MKWFTQAWWVQLWRTFTHDATWYPPEAAEAPEPSDEHFKTSAGGYLYMPSNHPADCAGKCCWEIRLSEMVEDFDWGAYEYEMRKTK